MLGVLISTYLYQTFPHEKEGILAKQLAHLVSKPSLAQVARAIGLGDHLNLDIGEERCGGRDKDSNLADACEALIGALYLDGGLEVAQKFVFSRWESLFVDMDLDVIEDAKCLLQEFLQQQGKLLPQYALLKKEGPQHEPLFTVGVRVDADQDFVTAQGKSKRLAEKDAAQKLLNQLREEA